MTCEDRLDVDAPSGPVSQMQKPPCKVLLEILPQRGDQSGHLVGLDAVDL